MCGDQSFIFSWWGELPFLSGGNVLIYGRLCQLHGIPTLFELPLDLHDHHGCCQVGLVLALLPIGGVEGGGLCVSLIVNRPHLLVVLPLNLSHVGSFSSFLHWKPWNNELDCMQKSLQNSCIVSYFFKKNPL